MTSTQFMGVILLVGVWLATLALFGDWCHKMGLREGLDDYARKQYMEMLKENEL